MTNIIEIKNLEKNYEKFTLKIDKLAIPKGNIVGLIGENGAGKTTLLKAILKIITIDKGTITICPNEDIGVVLDNIFFPEILKVKDLDTIMRDIYQNWDSELYNSYLQEFNLPNQTIKKLSKGMRKKLEIAVALSHHPKLLILDEPTNGLDPIMRSEVLDIFLKFIEDEEHSILLSTHITSDLEHIADKIVFIDKGQIILEKTRDELMDNYGILKCGVDDFAKIAKEDIITYKKGRFNYEILMDNKKQKQKKYKEFIMDKITLEELMVLLIKGEK